jgi:hydroxypyruvate isomerase
MERRTFIQTGIAASAALAGGALAAGAGSAASSTAGHSQDARTPLAAQELPAAPGGRRGRVKQSVCKWCYGNMSLVDLCRAAKGMGILSVELLNQDEWTVPRDNGLTCAVANGPSGISKGWNRIEHHDEFVAKSKTMLPLIAVAGIPNMIVFSGNRDGMSDAEGIRNCAKGLERIMPAAEASGVTIIMELLNSKVNHKDYMCDRTAWGVELVQGGGSGALQAALRHLPHADHGGRRDRTIQQEHPAHRPLSHRRRARPQRDR